MQRLVAMNKIAFILEDRITPSIMKRLELLKEKQRDWVVFPSSFQELEVRKGYTHVGTDLDAGVSYWYSQEAWFNAYQFFIKPVCGLNMWRRTNDIPPLPPLIKKMADRPGGRSGGRCDRSGDSSERGDGSGGNGGGMSGTTRRDGEQAKLYKERREEQEWENRMDYFNPENWREDSLEEAHYNQVYQETFIPYIHSQPTRQSAVYRIMEKPVIKKAQALDISVTTVDLKEAPYVETTLTTAEIKEASIEKGNTLAAIVKGKALAVKEDKPEPKKKRGRPKTHVDGIKIYYKNLGRCERISNMKKAFIFDKDGTGRNRSRWRHSFSDVVALTKLPGFLLRRLRSDIILNILRHLFYDMSLSQGIVTPSPATLWNFFKRFGVEL
nr:leucine-rich repeat-containing protein [Tanacetum cinerariifolium]